MLFVLPGEHYLNLDSVSHLQRMMARFCIAVRAIALSCCWGAILSMAAVFPSTMTSEELAPGVTIPVNSSDASSLGTNPHHRAGWIGQFDQYVFSSFFFPGSGRTWTSLPLEYHRISTPGGRETYRCTDVDTDRRNLAGLPLASDTC